MDLLFKLVFLSIAANLAVGFMTNVVGVDPQYMNANLAFNANDTYDFEQNMGQNITPSGLVENKGNALFRILDMLTIGWFNKFVKTIDSYMFGFVNFIGAIIRPYMQNNAWMWLFGNTGIMKLVMGVVYGLGLFYLWTGRDLTGSR
jgi:hypothetical protein